MRIRREFEEYKEQTEKVIKELKVKVLELGGELN